MATTCDIDLFNKEEVKHIQCSNTTDDFDIFDLFMPPPSRETNTDFINIYKETDILHNKNDIEKFGFSKHKTLGEMIDLAFKYKCPIIIKAGKNAKWYLKGNGRNIDELKKLLEKNEGTKRKGINAYLINDKYF